MPVWGSPDPRSIPERLRPARSIDPLRLSRRQRAAARGEPATLPHRPDLAFVAAAAVDDEHLRIDTIRVARREFELSRHAPAAARRRVFHMARRFIDERALAVGRLALVSLEAAPLPDKLRRDALERLARRRLRSIGEALLDPRALLGRQAVEIESLRLGASLDGDRRDALPEPGLDVECCGGTRRKRDRKDCKKKKNAHHGRDEADGFSERRSAPVFPQTVSALGRPGGALGALQVTVTPIGPSSRVS